jgi:hypothetical protein
MKKKLKIVLLILVSLAIAMFAIRFLSGPEDTWICSQGVRVKHGKPSAPQPTTPCQTKDFIPSSTTMRILAERNNNEYLPKAYTCEGIGGFPELSVQEIPLDAQSLALIVDDPDAPGGIWDHLLVANIPISAQSMNITASTLGA